MWGKLLTTLITTHAPTSMAQGERKKRILNIGGKLHKPSSPQIFKIKIIYPPQKEKGREGSDFFWTTAPSKGPDGVRLNLHTEKFL